MTWPGWRYDKKKQSLMSPSMFEVGAVLSIIKCDPSKTTYFSRTINRQIILVSCTSLPRDALKYWKVWTTAKLEWFILQQPRGPHFSSPPSSSFSSNFHSYTLQGPASKTPERLRAPVSEAKHLRSASRLSILATSIIVNFLINLRNLPSSCWTPTNIVILVLIF